MQQARLHGAEQREQSDAVSHLTGSSDDTNVLTGSLANMRIQNDWVHYFMRFNLLNLNHNKCEFVGRYAGENPTDVTAADLQLHGIAIEGNPIEPVAHDHPIRYLGVHCCFNGSWRAQHTKSLGMIYKFTSIVRKFEVSKGVHTNRGFIGCDIIVNCGGQWARQIGALAGVKVPLHSAEHFYIVTTPLNPTVTPNLPVMRDPDVYTPRCAVQTCRTARASNRSRQVD